MYPQNNPPQSQSVHRNHQANGMTLDYVNRHQSFGIVNRDTFGATRTLHDQALRRQSNQNFGAFGNNPSDLNGNNGVNNSLGNLNSNGMGQNGGSVANGQTLINSNNPPGHSHTHF